MKITRALLSFAMTTASIFFGCSSSNGATSSTGGSTSTSSSSSPSSSSSMTSSGATASSTSSTSTSSASSTSTGGSSTSTSGSSASSSSGGGTIYCGHPSDCAAGTYCASDGTCQTGMCGATSPCIYGYACSAGGVCASPTPNACDSDVECASGSLCLAGPDGKGAVCTTQADQCFDQAQCGAGEVCAAGTCIGSCTTNADCRDGYACNITMHICTTPIQACSITNDCGGAADVCVDGACVPRSIGGNCPNAGDVWTENGCIPDQTATFTCITEGQLGSGNGVPGQTCKSGSICLHHDCWISCDAPNQNACANQPILNTCKPVTSGASTYNVCGTAQNLGSQCGAGAANMSCAAGFLCIDGFCK